MSNNTIVAVSPTTLAPMAGAEAKTEEQLYAALDSLLSADQTLAYLFTDNTIGDVALNEGMIYDRETGAVVALLYWVEAE